MIRKTERRRRAREPIDVALSVICTDLDGRETLMHARLLDISASGARLSILAADPHSFHDYLRMFENTAQRVFYVSKPASGDVNYIADIQGKTKRCVARIRVKVGYSEDEVKKIVGTVTEKK